MSFNPIKIGLLFVVFLFGLSLFFGSWFQVEQNERDVVNTWGKYSYVAQPGLNFKLPIIQGTQTFRVDIQDMKPAKPVNTYTIDNQEVDVTFNLFYRLPEDRIEHMYATNRDFRDRLYTMTIDRLKTEMGKVNVQIVAENRGKLRDNILHVLQTEAKALDVEVTDFQLTDLQFTEGFRNAVNQAAIAKAGIEKIEYERQQAEKSAMTAKVKAEGEANAQRASAAGNADSLLLNATAKAKAIVLEGEAQARALKAQTEALRESPSLVELKKAERWDGKLPTQMFGGAPMPFMNIPTNASSGK